MPRGSNEAKNITAIERVNRLNEISKLVDKGLTPRQISKEMDLSEWVVDNYCRQLQEFNIDALTPEVINKKRIEIDEEYIEAVNEAKAQFFRYIEDEVVDGEVVRAAKPETARRFHERWTDTLQKRAKLYGLDSIKVEANNWNQVNTQNNQYDLDSDQINSIAEALEKGK